MRNQFSGYTRNAIRLASLLALLLITTACRTPPSEGLAATTAPPPTQSLSTTADLPTVAPPTPLATAAATQYPGDAALGPPDPTQTPQNYPASAPTAAATSADNSAYPGPYPGTNDVYVPLTGSSPLTPTPSMTPPPLPAATPTPAPTVDFAAQRAALQANGQELGFVKLGFHVTLLEDRDRLDNWMQRLDDAGVPFFLKTVDNAEPLFRAQQLMQASGVPHVLVYRASGGVPEYNLPPEQAAQRHWIFHRDQFPPELDPNLVWIETLNEPDRMQSEWLGRFALETARLALADGFRWAAFGWAAGEPEPEQWQTPSMLAFVRLAGENPEQLAIALHEYSYIADEIGHDYPYKIGRFQELFRIADVNGFPRPTVLITEWGWEYADIPDVDVAMQDVGWASRLYAPFPQVKGAAIWNLGIGCCYDDISEQVSELVDPLTEYALREYFAIPQPPAEQPIDPTRFQP